jgi:hypothetical protein
MSVSDRIALAAVIIAVISMIGGAIGWWYQRNEMLKERAGRQREEQNRKIAEAELEAIVRRSQGPYLRAQYVRVPAYDGINALGQNARINSTSLRPSEEVDRNVPQSIQLNLILKNDGAQVRDVNDDWPQGQGINVTPFGMKDYAELVYPYDPKKHGQQQRITIKFETSGGLKLHQTYEGRHGFCELRRIDPP